MSALQESAQALTWPVTWIGIAATVSWLLLAMVTGASLRSHPRKAWALFWLSKAWMPVMLLGIGLRIAAEGDVAVAGGVIAGAALLTIGSLFDGRLAGSVGMVGGAFLASSMTWSSWVAADRTQASIFTILILGILVAGLVAPSIRSRHNSTKPPGDAHA